VAPTKIANTMAVTLMVSVLVSCSIFQLRRWYNAAKTNASLFYLKGVAPKSIQTTDIYKGVIPFIIIQVSVLISLIVFPQWYGFNEF
jgi:TRAP-type mannitol/chloroaromatic compound transport system permease large subunit